MIELKQDSLLVSFPELTHKPSVSIAFKRTLRIPDDGRDYPLPPGLGSFPLRHIDDYAAGVPQTWLKRGGVLLPMWQSEALWLWFDARAYSDRDASYPFAIKVATGKISAVTGAPWNPGLTRDPQDYLVIPDQPWLDGYCVEKGVIRQFVAMPLGQGYSVEEQLTGEAEFGGLQIEVFPMKPEVFSRRFPRVRRQIETCALFDRLCAAPPSAMGLGAGGRMRQEIYDDSFDFSDWDTTHSGRCFIHLVNAGLWRQMTGEDPPSTPLTARQYIEAGFPWFEYYDSGHEAMEGSSILAKVKTVNQKGTEIRQPLPDNQSLPAPNTVQLRAGLRRHQVRESAL